MSWLDVQYTLSCTSQTKACLIPIHYCITYTLNIKTLYSASTFVHMHNYTKALSTVACEFKSLEDFPWCLCVRMTSRRLCVHECSKPSPGHAVKYILKCCMCACSTPVHRINRCTCRVCLSVSNSTPPIADLCVWATVPHKAPGCPLMGQDNNRQFRLRSGSVLNRYSSVEVGQAQFSRSLDSKLERS